MSEPQQYVAGWGDKTRVFASLPDVAHAFPEVFTEAWHGSELWLTSMRACVTRVNAEGNYDDFTFRPSWPDELSEPEGVLRTKNVGLQTKQWLCNIVDELYAASEAKARELGGHNEEWEHFAIASVTPKLGEIRSELVALLTVE